MTESMHIWLLVTFEITVGIHNNALNNLGAIMESLLLFTLNSTFSQMDSYKTILIGQIAYRG